MTPPQVRSLSLNQVETLSAKAARGAGLAWGLAEDVGRATRWMAERGFAWAPALLHLTGSDAAADQLRPVFRVADLLPGACPGTRWPLDASEPLWPLAILSGALYGRDLSVDLTWPGVVARLQPDGGVTADAAFEARVPQPIVVSVGVPAPPLPYRVTTRTRRCCVSAELLGALEGLAARTYVPASTQSRATGAGGGRVDDD